MDRKVAIKITVHSFDINLGTTRVMKRSKERINSRETATTVENLTTKRPVVGRNILRKNYQV